jgi:UDP-N-acetylglucosamine diphosphorylase/glucosamine-1-phosphate N-acetyltransferase
MAQTAAVILAAGKSTRMNSDLPKVLHPVCGRSMLGHVIDACRAVGVDRLVVVVGHRKDLVIDAFSNESGITWVEQTEQLGTGHAVLACEAALGDFEGQTLVIAGDMPLLRSETLRELLEANASTSDSVTLATSIFDDPTSYGRIVRDESGNLVGIVEHADCTDEQRAIREVNISYYCFDNRKLFSSMHDVTPNNTKGEYYITDAVRILIGKGERAAALPIVDPEDAFGVNSQADLAMVNETMHRRNQNQLGATPS